MEEIEESFIEEDKIFTAKDKPYYQSYCGSTHFSVSDTGFQLSPARRYQFPSVTPGNWIET